MSGGFHFINEGLMLFRGIFGPIQLSYALRDFYSRIHAKTNQKPVQSQQNNIETTFNMNVV